MARNGSGSFSLVAGNPVTTGTQITATWANNTLSDIASEITGSVAADGQTTITGPIKFSAGSVAAPALTFSSETNTGFYRSASNVVSMSIAGSQKYILGASSVTLAGSASITGTEFGYLTGVTSAIQTQLDAKQPLDATLTALAGALTAANKIPYATAADTLGELTRIIDGTLAGNSDTNIPTEKAVKTYVDAHTTTPASDSYDAANTFSTASTTVVDVTSATVTLTTSGGNVLTTMAIQGSNSSAATSVTLVPYIGNTAGRAYTFYLKDNATSHAFEVTSLWKSVAAGSNTFKLGIYVSAGTITLSSAKVVAVEIK